MQVEIHDHRKINSELEEISFKNMAEFYREELIELHKNHTTNMSPREKTALRKKGLISLLKTRKRQRFKLPKKTVVTLGLTVDPATYYLPIGRGRSNLART